MSILNSHDYHSWYVNGACVKLINMHATWCEVSNLEVWISAFLVSFEQRPENLTVSLPLGIFTEWSHLSEGLVASDHQSFQSFQTFPLSRLQRRVEWDHPHVPKVWKFPSWRLRMTVRGPLRLHYFFIITFVLLIIFRWISFDSLTIPPELTPLTPVLLTWALQQGNTSLFKAPVKSIESPQWIKYL